MKTLQSHVPLWAAALWWGSLTAVGFMVVPLLFAHLPTPALAGNMAARLFTAQTWLSVACAMVLLLAARSKSDSHTTVARAQPALLYTVAGLVLALWMEFGVAPRIVARDNLRLWHSVGTVMYIVQWLCAGVALGYLARRAQPDGGMEPAQVDAGGQRHRS